MNVEDLLAMARRHDLALWVEGDRLRYRGAPQQLGAEFRQALQAQRRELIALLRDAEAPGAERPPLRSRPRTGRLPLSFAQQRLWLIDQLQPQQATYNLPGALHLSGPLNFAALEQAIGELFRRHEALRTAFATMPDGEPAQIIAVPATYRLPVTDLRVLPARERADVTARRLRELECRQFNLATGPVARFELLLLGEQEHILAWNFHHIAFDGWSQGVFARELSELYAAHAAGATASLPALPVQYADYALWQREWLQGDRLAAALSYWKQELADAALVLDLPADHPRPAVQSVRGGRETFRLPAGLTTALNALSQREGATLFMTLLAGFQTLLHRYTEQEDILVSTPVAGREAVETEGLIGFFVNTLAMRGRFAGRPTFRELLQRVRQTALGAYAHQELPFERLVEELQPGRDLSRPPLCQVMFAFQNTAPPQFELPGLTVQPLEHHLGVAQFDLLLEMTESDGELRGQFAYCADLFDEARMRRLSGHLQTLLEAAVATPDCFVAELPLLTAAEHRQLFVEWNDTRLDYERERTLPEFIEVQAARWPAATALIHETTRLSYGELNRRANQLARHLRQRGVGPDTLVGICLERTWQLPVALLAVLKAGGAYVPLDPSYPAERTAMILEDARAPLLLTQRRFATGLPGRLVLLDELDLSAESDADLGPVAAPSDLAYVIFTSGSTGRPKGVALEHRNAVSLIAWARTQYAPAEFAGMGFSTSVCFDMSIFELFATLSLGGTAILVENALELAAAPAAAEVTFLDTVPSVARELLRSGRIPPAVRTINLGGEYLPQSLVERLYELPHVEKVYDMYGPTETTTFSTCVLRQRGGPQTLGRPIVNTELYLLDAHRQPVPIGVPGELYIGGEGVARGYLNRPELTAERFLPHPFDPRRRRRIYRTGDRMRYRADGTLEFLGRLDHQVKVRGFRVELGEIESALRGAPGVRDAVVVTPATGSGETQLVAFLLSQNGGLAVEELRRHLRRTLPEYMVPAEFVRLEKFPLTPTGKINRGALPAVAAAGGHLESSRPFAAPRTVLEAKLVEIWVQVLRRQPIGIHHDFFTLGGHSLLATQVMARIHETFGVTVPLRCLFEHPTVSALATHVEALLWAKRGHEPLRAEPGTMMEGEV